MGTCSQNDVRRKMGTRAHLDARKRCDTPETGESRDTLRNFHVVQVDSR